jgi:hypothetical protein
MKQKVLLNMQLIYESVEKLILIFIYVQQINISFGEKKPKVKLLNPLFRIKYFL